MPRKRCPQAIDGLTRAIGYGADDSWSGCGWLGAGCGSQRAGQGGGLQRVCQVADPVERGNALFLIARDFDRHDKFKEALALFQMGLASTQSPAVAERVDQLKRLVAFRVTKVDIAAEADSPRACLRFNEKIATKADLSYGDYVRATPDPTGIVTAKGETLCIDGLKHGQAYEVELLAGFTADSGEKTPETWKTRLVVPARQPAISFAGGCPAARGQRRLAVTTINVEKVKLRLVRINERNRAEHQCRKADDELRPRNVDELIEQTAVWCGRRDGDRRRAQPAGRDRHPLTDILRDKGPGCIWRRSIAPTGNQATAASTNWVLYPTSD
jgi:hypothetical protein